jgi:succinate-semialdehyde dehydrogenase / glutarate-semialdehyde dehydrogenase
MAIATINPASNETVRTFDALTRDEIDSKIAQAWSAYEEGRDAPFADRSRLLVRAAEVLERERERWAALLTLEMGKTIVAARAEVDKCALVCRYYAENGARLLADEYFETHAAESWVRYEPLGPVLAVMPWNFPFWQVFRFAAPALMAGNTGLLKHSSNVPQCALAIEEIFSRAGFPEGSFQALLIGSAAVEQLLRDSRVRAATLTGSEPAGASVASIAGEEIKKVVLELGGSDPFIVMPSADLEKAVETAVKARIINNGQSCIAAKRFIVHEEIAEEFERRFVERFENLRVGDPMDESTDVGPLATPQVLEDLEGQVEESVRAGATVLTGAKRIEGKGNYFQPGILTDIPAGSPADCDELFGPVASLFRARDIADAIRIANATSFGLGASAWTGELAEQHRFAREIESGQVFVNAMVASDPKVPFGGVKRSGFGRELGPHGIREFVNAKTVWIA